MHLAFWPTCLVIVGKEHGAPRGGSNSPRYVVTEGVLPSAARDRWHITEVDPLPEVLPKVWRAYCDSRFNLDGGKQRMLEAMVWAVQKQNFRQRNPDNYAGGQNIDSKVLVQFKQHHHVMSFCGTKQVP